MHVNALLSGWSERGELVLLDFLDPTANPFHHVYRHGVARCLVARTVRGAVLAPPRDLGVVVGEALQPFGLGRRQVTDGRRQSDGWLTE